MRFRLLASLAILPVLVVGSVSSAAPRPPKPSCNLVTDAAGDAKALLPAGTAPSTSMDILSADLAATAKEGTAVIRLKALKDLDLDAGYAQEYYFEFKPNGAPKSLYLLVRLGGEHVEGPYIAFGTADYSTSPITYARFGGVPARPVIDPAKSEIRIHFPLTAFAPTGIKLSKGTKVGGFIVRTLARFTAQGQGPEAKADEAVSAKNKIYVVGGSSCVRVGI